jgi:3-oxoacyl-[acyl-carrier protein] reductase
MDLGISGRKAIVCASSRGLGRGCATSLAREGVDVTINGRDEEVLQATAADIAKETGAKVTAVAADVTTPEGQAKLLAACPAPDILVNNAGGPPPGDFRDWSREDWMKGIVANMLTPIVTSGATKSPIRELGMSNGARTGLAGFVAGIARETVRHNVTINCLLPGPFDTDRLRSNLRFRAEKAGEDYETFSARRAAENPAGRFGLPSEFGDACAFLCSAQMGFVTGQHFLMDGGIYRGTF